MGGLEEQGGELASERAIAVVKCRGERSCAHPLKAVMKAC
jgi:hypothetical protein